MNDSGTTPAGHERAEPFRARKGLRRRERRRGGTARHERGDDENRTVVTNAIAQTSG